VSKVIWCLSSTSFANVFLSCDCERRTFVSVMVSRSGLLLWRFDQISFGARMFEVMSISVWCTSDVCERLVSIEV
jgi:hypothetical protein